MRRMIVVVLAAAKPSQAGFRKVVHENRPSRGSCRRSAAVETKRCSASHDAVSAERHYDIGLVRSGFA